MRLERTVAGVRDALAAHRAETVALVPTMGAFHEGHLSLFRAAREEADVVVVSLFVNPAQFGPTEDFARYPRSPEADRLRCAEAGADLIFAPTVETMYPRGPISAYVEVPGLSDVLEGASRPGHFRGVATVVMKLLQIVGPDLATFGRKDYQQLLVIRRMVEDLDVPVRIRDVATVRETFSGWLHFFVFWGFTVLGLQIMTMFGRAYSDHFYVPLFSPNLLGGPYMLVRDLFEAPRVQPLERRVRRHHRYSRGRGRGRRDPRPVRARVLPPDRRRRVARAPAGRLHEGRHVRRADRHRRLLRGHPRRAQLRGQGRGILHREAG